MTLDIIKKPFAFQGDLTTPNQTSPTGFVNFQDGYTKDYEISLAAGNPQAKAVERMVQNYMFNQATEHAQAWQRQALPPWFAGMSDVAIGGYPLNAMVIRQQADLSWKPYRSLVAANVSDPLTTPAQWEYIRNEAESLALVPMPAGAGNAAAELITVGTDFNTLTSSGTYEVKVESVAAACSNLPTLDGNNVPGMLQIKSWNDGASLRVIQIYTSTASRVFSRSAVGAVWTAWNACISNTELRSLKFTFCVATVPVSANAIVLAATPVMTARSEGMQLQFKAVANTTGAVTINDGISVKPLVGLGGSALSGGEIKNNFDAVIEWNVGLDSWILIRCQTAMAQIAQSSYLSVSPPQFDSTTKIASMEALKRQGLQASSLITLNANTTLTASHAGASVISSAAGNTTWTLPVANAFPAGARIELANFAAGTVTVQRAGADTINASGNSATTSFAILTGSFSYLESDGVSAWLVVGGNAIIPTQAQFSSNLQGVNASFVQRASGNKSTLISGISGAFTFTLAHLGGHFNFNSGSALTGTLPNLTLITGASTMAFSNSGTATATVSAFSGQTIAISGGSSVSSVDIPPGGSLVLSTVNGAGTWFIEGGTAAAKYDIGNFGVSFSGNGWQKLPSGLIIQWGQTNLPGSNSSAVVTLPIAFPIGGLIAVASDTGFTSVAGASIASASSINVYASPYSISTGSIVAKSNPAVINWIVIGR